MELKSLSNRVTRAMERHAGRERGVVLFVALIVMVVMSIAAITLIRSVDTTNRVIGNLAFRQAAIQPAALAVEDAAQALFVDQNTTGSVLIPNKDADLPARNYYASWQKTDDANGIPASLQKKSSFTLARMLTDNAGNQIVLRDRADVHPARHRRWSTTAT